MEAQRLAISPWGRPHCVAPENLYNLRLSVSFSGQLLWRSEHASRSTRARAPVPDPDRPLAGWLALLALLAGALCSRTTTSLAAAAAAAANVAELAELA